MAWSTAGPPAGGGAAPRVPCAPPPGRSDHGTGRDLIVEYGPPIVGTLLFLLVAFIVSGWIGRLVRRAVARTRVDETVAGFLGHIVRWGLMVLAVIACLGVFGVETTSFAAVIGAAGLAIGLALQGSLSSLAAGVMLLTFRPFKAGDYISVAGEGGTVAEIDLFATCLDTPDNRRVIIPNSQVFGAVIENYWTG